MSKEDIIKSDTTPVGAFVDVQGKIYMVKNYRVVKNCRVVHPCTHCAFCDDCTIINPRLEQICLFSGKKDIPIFVPPIELTALNIDKWWPVGSFVLYKGVPCLVCDKENSKLNPRCNTCAIKKAGVHAKYCSFYCLERERHDGKDVFLKSITDLSKMGIVRLEKIQVNNPE